MTTLLLVDDVQNDYFAGGAHPLVGPDAAAGEAVMDKEFPNAFLGTNLTDRIAAARVERLVVVGMMTNMCIDATVREAVDRELDTVLVGDGCAASDLSWGGRTVDGATVHTAFVAALADAGASVVTGDDVEALLAS